MSEAPTTTTLNINTETQFPVLVPVKVESTFTKEAELQETSRATPSVEPMFAPFVPAAGEEVTVTPLDSSSVATSASSVTPSFSADFAYSHPDIRSIESPDSPSTLASSTQFYMNSETPVDTLSSFSESSRPQLLLDTSVAADNVEVLSSASVNYVRELEPPFALHLTTVEDSPVDTEVISVEPIDSERSTPLTDFASLTADPLASQTFVAINELPQALPIIPPVENVPETSIVIIEDSPRTSEVIPEPLYLQDATPTGEQMLDTVVLHKQPSTLFLVPDISPVVAVPTSLLELEVSSNSDRSVDSLSIYEKVPSIRSPNALVFEEKFVFPDDSKTTSAQTQELLATERSYTLPVPAEPLEIFEISNNIKRKVSQPSPEPSILLTVPPQEELRQSVSIDDQMLDSLRLVPVDTPGDYLSQPYLSKATLLTPAEEEHQTRTHTDTDYTVVSDTPVPAHDNTRTPLGPFLTGTDVILLSVEEVPERFQSPGASYPQLEISAPAHVALEGDEAVQVSIAEVPTSPSSFILTRRLDTVKYTTPPLLPPLMKSSLLLT
ncbi:mucin-2-like [Homarus americanus]|nr:mucin-2-like [Homarus americanus]